MGKEQTQVAFLRRVLVGERCPQSSQASFGLSSFVAHHLTSILRSLRYPQGEKEGIMHTLTARQLLQKEFQLFMCQNLAGPQVSPSAQTEASNGIIASKVYVGENGARELSCIIWVQCLQLLTSWKLYLASSQDGSAPSE